MAKVILPDSVIGIIGGGQLGQMMAQSAKEKGFKVIILDPQVDCPAAQVADLQIVAAYDNEQKILELAQRCDVVTYEFENVDVATIDKATALTYLPQGSEALSIAQDRVLEKAFLEQNNIVIAPYATIVTAKDIYTAIDSIGFPCVLKTTRGGYDGKGQHVIYSGADIEESKDLLRSGTCVLESWIPFEREISIMIARNDNGEQSVFPAIENIHRNNILHESICPARIDSEIEKEAQRVAGVVADAIHLVGTMGLEFFVTSTGALYVNEIAPRPHNSGHLTIEACDVSQFDAHIRGICNWPMPQPQLLSPAVMVNILGQDVEDTQTQILLKADWHFHYYGKMEAKKNRKMGHITILTSNFRETIEKIYDTRIWD